MSRSMWGYVEVYTYQKWELVFTTDTFLVGGNNYLMARLFGNVVQDEPPPIVSHRGRPEDASSEICAMYDHYSKGNDMVNAGWFLFAELQPHVEEIIGEHEGWLILYRMMEPLADFFGAERVRFTAWQLV